MYETVSIKPDKSDVPNNIIRIRSEQLTATNVTLQLVIRKAYGVGDNQISGAPNWLNSEKYDIEAKLDKSVVDDLQQLSPDQHKLEGDRMLQALLADRFKLTVHREIKKVPMYELVIAEGGPKLQESAPGYTYPDGRVIQAGRGQITGREVPVATLARLLSEGLGRTVLDKTGLADHYDVTLHWPAVEEGQQGTDNASSPESSGPSIFTAIQEQLGLKLEPQKVPMVFLVIDHVEMASED